MEKELIPNKNMVNNWLYVGGKYWHSINTKIKTLQNFISFHFLALFWFPFDSNLRTCDNVFPLLSFVLHLSLNKTIKNHQHLQHFFASFFFATFLKEFFIKIHVLNPGNFSFWISFALLRQTSLISSLFNHGTFVNTPIAHIFNI